VAFLRLPSGQALHSGLLSQQSGWRSRHGDVFSYDGVTWQVHLNGRDINSLLESSDGLVTIKVYDVDGKLRRVLTEDQPMSQGIQVVSWNGRSEVGEILPSGLYLITITIEKQTEIKTVVIQNR